MFPQRSWFKQFGVMGLPALVALFLSRWVMASQWSILEPSPIDASGIAPLLTGSQIEAMSLPNVDDSRLGDPTKFLEALIPVVAEAPLPSYPVLPQPAHPLYFHPEAQAMIPDLHVKPIFPEAGDPFWSSEVFQPSTYMRMDASIAPRDRASRETSRKISADKEIPTIYLKDSGGIE